MTELIKRPPKITQSKFHAPGYKTLNYTAEVEYGVPLDRVLEDDFWGHVSAALKVGYTIEVMPEGLPYYAKLIVIDCGPTFAKVKLLQYVDLMDEVKVNAAPIVSEVNMGKFKVERNGAWFRVIRNSDKEVMKSGFRRMVDAEAWVRENLVTA